MFSIQFFQPTVPQLKRYVQDYWMIEGQHANILNHVRQFFSHGGLEFSFNLATPLEYLTDHSPLGVLQNSQVIGALSRAMSIRLTGSVKLFGVRFKPGCAFPFVPIPAHECTDRAFELADVLGPSVQQFTEKMCQPEVIVSQRIHVLETFLNKRLETSRPYDTTLEAAIDAIISNHGQIRIQTLATRLNISTRQLERKFQEKVGLSPKHLCRTIRFQRVFDHLRTFPHDTWTSVALSCGYFDQSHFINECLDFTGCCPSDYFDQTRRDDFFEKMRTMSDFSKTT